MNEISNWYFAKMFRSPYCPIRYLESFLYQSIFLGPDHFDITKLSCIWVTAKYISSLHVKILQKNEFVENVWPANSALFIYISIHCVEYNRYS